MTSYRFVNQTTLFDVTTRFSDEPKHLKIPGVDLSRNSFFQPLPPASPESGKTVPDSVSISRLSKPGRPTLETKKKSHSRRQPPGHIPRPRNAFILFRCDFVRQKKIPQAVEHDHRNISRIVGRIWREMNEEEKAPWVAKASEERRLHARLYPGYKYSSSSGTSTSKRKATSAANKDDELSFSTHPIGPPKTSVRPRRISSCPPAGSVPVIQAATDEAGPLATRDDLARKPSHATMYSTTALSSKRAPAPGTPEFDWNDFAPHWVVGYTNENPVPPRHDISNQKLWGQDVSRQPYLWLTPEEHQAGGYQGEIETSESFLNYNSSDRLQYETPVSESLCLPDHLNDPYGTSHPDYSTWAHISHPTEFENLSLHDGSERLFHPNLDQCSDPSRDSSPFSPNCQIHHPSPPVQSQYIDHQALPGVAAPHFGYGEYRTSRKS